MRHFYSCMFLCAAQLVFLHGAFCQQINLYSISASRQTSGDHGYTLDGDRMIYSRSKLLDENNFGSGGTYPKTILITDAFAQTGSLAALEQYPDIDILFIGSFNRLDPSLHQYSAAELDTLYNWSKNGGKLIIATQASIPGSWEFTQFDSRWGFSMVISYPSTFSPTVTGSSSEIYNGAFGQVLGANQGGSAQGYFTLLPPNAVVLAENFDGNPTLFLDCNTYDLVCADVDAFTDLGGITYGTLINNYQDRFWANIITYMDKLETGTPPVITINGDQLSTQTYPAYQWFENGMEINGATDQFYVGQDSSQYTVQVTYSCGCTAISLPVNYAPPADAANVVTGCELIIPSAFSPNGDGVNDELHVLGNTLLNFYSFSFKIFNRWGEEVFETNNVNQGWDGSYKETKHGSDVFTYSIEGICSATGKKIFRKGNVTLVK